MPKALHEALHRRALEHGFKPGSPRYKRYVYGTLQKVDKQHEEHAARRAASETLRSKPDGRD